MRGRCQRQGGKTIAVEISGEIFRARGAIDIEIDSDIAAAPGRRRQGGEGRLQAGAELGGIPLVTVTSLKTLIPCVFVRNKKKDYGTSKQLEGVVNKGDITVLVEDVATTAGQALEAVASLRDAGADVRAIIATIDRQEGARENVEKANLLFIALFTKADLGICE